MPRERGVSASEKKTTILYLWIHPSVIMATARARLLVSLLVVAAGVARGDLYHQLAQDDAAVDQMANVVGAGETQALVDHQLHKVGREGRKRRWWIEHGVWSADWRCAQVQARRDKVADATAGLKARAKATYLALQRAEKEEADANNLRRHLKEQLEIVTAEDKEKKEVAEKAEEIAKKMQEMAAKADGAWKEVRAAKRKTAAGFAEAKTDYAQRKEAAKEAQTKRRQAEDKAQLASTRLAAADKDVRVLLQVRRIWICRCLCRCATALGPPSDLSRLSPCALRLLTKFAAGASVCIRSTKSWRRCGWQRTQNRRLALRTHSGRTLSARTPSRRPCFVPRPLNGSSSSL